jgi:hypothetical protein
MGNTPAPIRMLLPGRNRIAQSNPASLLMNAALFPLRAQHIVMDIQYLPRTSTTVLRVHGFINSRTAT